MKRLLWPLLALLLLGCTRNSKDASTTVQLALPQTGSASHLILSQSVGAMSGGSQLPSITSSSEINCYVLMVGGAPDDPNYCTNSAGARITTFGPMVGGVPAGQTVSIDLKSGSSRIFYLMGAKAQNGACKNFFDGQGPDGQNMSSFRLLDTKTVSLSPGEMKISMSVPSDLTNLPEENRCHVQGIPDNGSGGGNEYINLADLFGDGRDGSFNTSGSGTVNLASSFSSHTWLGHIPGVTGSSKLMATTRTISNVQPNGQITMATSFGAIDFEDGDEVLWYVTAAWASGGPESACGGELGRGSWGRARVSAASTPTMVLNPPISTAALNNTNIANTNTTLGQEFCRIVLTRIVSVTNFTINPGHSVEWRIPAMVAGFDSGGLAALRVRNLSVGAGSALFLNANAYAYLGVSYEAGPSNAGRGGTVTTTVYSGGGYDSSGANGAGGGGNAGAGGAGGTGIEGGKAISICSGPCLPWAAKKAMMGGAGGASATPAGGRGGGSVFLFVENATGTGLIKLEANGDDSAGSYGAGAGGSVLMMGGQVSSGLTVQLAAKGGSTTSATSGGAGGGGFAEYKSCSGSLTPSVAASGGAILGGGSGIAGQNGVGVWALNYSPLCSNP